MIVQIYEAVVIKQGLARITLSLYDGDDFQGEYELAVEVTSEDTVKTIQDKIRKLLNTAFQAPPIVFELAGTEFEFTPDDSTVLEVLPEYKKANAE